MILLEDLLSLNEIEKDFRELYLKYPQIHQNPPKTLQQLLQNEIEYPEYKTVYERSLKQCPGVSTYLSENLFEPKEDVALLMHYRYVPGFIHYHEFFEIVYVLNGKYRNFINGHLVEFEKGDVCILAPYVYHCPTTGLEDDVVLNILVRSSTFDCTFFHILRNNPTLATFFSRSLTTPNGGSYLKFSTQDDREVESILLAMLNEYRNRALYYAPMINQLMSALFLLLLRNYSTTLESAFTDHLNFSKKIILMLDYIKNNLQSVTFSELANKFSYSERQLSRLFMKYTGRTFKDILQDMRLQKACLLLQEENIPINAVISQCGYKNQNHFYNMFRKYCGKTPAQYRKDIALEKSLQSNLQLPYANNFNMDS